MKPASCVRLYRRRCVTLVAFVISIMGSLATGRALLAAQSRQDSTSPGRHAQQRGAGVKVAAEVRKPRFVAVRIHHDLCPFCGVLSPEFDRLQREAGDAILFITLDTTSERTQEQAALLVGALGLDGLWTGDLSRLATVSFVDFESKAVLSSVRAADAEQAKRALREAVAALPGP